MRYFSLIVVACVLLFSLGCDKGLRTEYIEGVVTLDNSPVDGALVTFIPNGTGARIATGQTDAQGKYVLTTPEGGKHGKGTTTGDYLVTVAKREPEPEGIAREEAIKAATPPAGKLPSVEEAAHLEMVTKSFGFAPPWAYLTPKKYDNVATSGFTATVVKGRNKFDFSMESE